MENIRDWIKNSKDWTKVIKGLKWKPKDWI